MKRPAGLTLMGAGLALLCACGGQAEEETPPPAAQAGAPAIVPEPSGPPIVQQAQPDAAGITQPGLKWEAAGAALRLLNPDGSLRLSIACSGGALRASVPSFTPVGSEDRFALGIGAEPVTLVADPTRQKAGAGVTGEGPVPANFAALLSSANQVSAMYGSQQIGPHIPPPPELASSLAKRCGA